MLGGKDGQGFAPLYPSHNLECVPWKLARLAAPKPRLLPFADLFLPQKLGFDSPLAGERLVTTAEAIDDRVKHSHPENVAHHFESAQQQFDAGKLGMWLFLVTEVLFFSGLFVLYAVYRSNHPEVFVNAHKYLNTTLGALNTIVLLVSSLTMAWAVRCAQLGQQRGLVSMLAATLALSSLFLGIKAVEYSHKWGEGLLWAGAFSAGIARPQCGQSTNHKGNAPTVGARRLDVDRFGIGSHILSLARNTASFPALDMRHNCGKHFLCRCWHRSNGPAFQ